MSDVPEDRRQPPAPAAETKDKRRPVKRVGRRSYADRAMGPESEDLDPRLRKPGTYQTK